ncbi:MarR family winged helix-turn-helix transcriptional regulator [Parasphingorhabdus pacifica]
MSESTGGESEYLSLDRQLCFALYSASRAFTNLYRPLLDELGLTYPQYLVMLVLWEREAVSVKQLGSLLRLDSGTLSPLLKRLQTGELITRRRNAEDERSVEVALTDSGRELRERAREIPRRMLAATGLTSVEEVDELRTALERITANLDTATERARTEIEAGRGIPDDLSG